MKTLAKKNIKSQTLPNPDDFNLNYDYAPDLLEVPEDPESVAEYARQCAHWINLEMQKPEEQWDIKTLVTYLGRTAALLKMLRDLDEALAFVETALSIIEQYDLGANHFVVQSIRWGDILRYRGEFGEAEEVFEGVIDLCQKMPTVKEYEDVALQHLGKLHFDLGEYKEALKLFKKALVIRKAKADQNLIDSTEVAIEITQSKIKELKK